MEILPMLIGQNNRLDCIQAYTFSFMPELSKQHIQYLETILFLIESNPL
jgi:hypothetical protein